MTRPIERQRATLAEYFQREAHATDKHEYRDGEIIMMPGGTLDHGLIIANIIGELRSYLKGKPCRVYDGVVRVGIPRRTLYTYPDLSVVCGPRQSDPEDPAGGTLTNPRVIVEVLSPSTEQYDRGEKFERYTLVESLEEYVLVSQTMPRVEIYRRQGESWLFTWASGLAAIAKVASLEIDLPLAEIYSGVVFPAAPPASNEGL